MLCALLAAAAAASLPPTIGLSEALRLFRQQGFDALLADEAVNLARADELAAAAVANPTLSGSVGRSFGYDPAACPGCSATAFGLGIADGAAISDSLLGKRGLRLSVARAALEAAKRSRADAQRTLELQVA